MSQTVRIAAISGSLRERSYNTALLRVAAERSGEDVEVRILDLSAIPLFNADDEKLLGYPDSVARLRRGVAESDGLIVATPEYNGSFPGVLKNALDWLSRGSDAPLQRLPVATIGGAGRFGASGAQRHLREVLHSTGSIVAPYALSVSRVWDDFDDDLRLTNAATGERLERVVRNLAAFAGRLSPSGVDV